MWFKKLIIFINENRGGYGNLLPNGVGDGESPIFIMRIGAEMGTMNDFRDGNDILIPVP